MKRICVYCGSKTGNRPEYLNAAEELGKVLALNGISLVYGGGNSGMMGKISSAVMANGGEAIGVIPKTLPEIKCAGSELSEIHIVGNIHERKALMMELSDGFIAMPGGLGTFEEFFEVLNWSKLGLHDKPYGLLNTCHYFSKLVELLDHIANEGFLNPSHKSTIHIADDPHELVVEITRHWV